MNLLALDFGAQRIGAATARTDIGIAFARNALDNDANAVLFQDITALIAQYNIDQILVGHPGALSDEGSHQTQKCRNFADDLEDYLQAQNITVPVEYVDEAFSTQVAKAQLQTQQKAAAESKYMVDSLAAAAFLQTFLDQHTR